MWKKSCVFFCAATFSLNFLLKGSEIGRMRKFPHPWMLTVSSVPWSFLPPIIFCACMLRSMKSVYCAKRDNKMSVWKIDNFLLIVVVEFFSGCSRRVQLLQTRSSIANPPNAINNSELGELVQSINKRVFRVCSTFYSCVWFFFGWYLQLFWDLHITHHCQSHTKKPHQALEFVRLWITRLTPDNSRDYNNICNSHQLSHPAGH